MMKLSAGTVGDSTEGKFYLSDNDDSFMVIIDKIVNTGYTLELSCGGKNRGSIYQNGEAVILNQAKELGLIVEDGRV